MAGDAIAAHRRSFFALRCDLLVAALAFHFSVSPVKQILGPLVVVEVPQGPGPDVVTTLAALTQCELVLVFLFMAGITLSGRILETRSQMTALAGCNKVSTNQREA